MDCLFPVALETVTTKAGQAASKEPQETLSEKSQTTCTYVESLEEGSKL